MKYCPNCGNQLDDATNYCPNCGLEQSPRNDQTENTVPLINESKNSKKKSHLYLYIILGILTLVVIGMIGYYFYSSSQKNKIVYVNTPTFSVNSGTYDQAQKVTITSGTSEDNFNIYYTLDGSTPTSSSLKYNLNSPITIDKTTTLKSVAYDQAGNMSAIATANYEIEVAKKEDDEEEEEPVIFIGDNTNNTSSDSNKSKSSNSKNIDSSISKDSYNSSYDTSSPNFVFFPNSDTEEIQEYYLEGLDRNDLILARNEIYARHGRMFNTDWIQEYFDDRSWYVPRISPEDFDARETSILNKTEIKNVKTIKAYETKMGYN